MNFEKLIEVALSKGIEALEVYHQTTHGMSIDMYNDDIDQYQINDTKGISVRGIYKGKMGYVGLEIVDDSYIDFIVDKIIENASAIERNDKVIIYSGSEKYEVDTKKYTDFSNISPTEKINILREFKDLAFKADSRVKTVEASFAEKVVDVEIVNSYNLNLSHNYSYAILYLSIVMEENNESKSHYDYLVLNDLDFNKEEFVKKAVNDLSASLNPKKIKSGVYNVVIKNRVMQGFLGCFLSSFTGTSAKNKTTPLLNKVGEKIGNDLINLIDNPLDERAYFASTFDDEGVSTYKKEIVKNGVFKMFMHNLETGLYFNTNSTGNGFKAGLMGKVSVSHTNFALEPMEHTFDELVNAAQDGIYLTSTAGMHAGVNPVSGAFSLQASGFKIINGKIDEPITLFVVSGNFYDLLKNIEMIGNDFEYGTSSIGSASVLVKLDIAGENE